MSGSSSTTGLDFGRAGFEAGGRAATDGPSATAAAWVTNGFLQFGHAIRVPAGTGFGALSLAPQAGQPTT